MGHPFLDRFLHIVESDYRAVFTESATDGRRLLVEFADDRYDPPLVLDFTEEEFVAAVHTTDAGGRQVWPDVPSPEGAIRLMTVHLEESLLSQKPVSRRVYLSDGQIRAE